jgi:hypothetical protein
VGARLDEQPELIFRLRRVDAKDLVSQAGAGLPKSKHAPAVGKVLDDALLADVFGIEMAGEASPTRPARSRRDPKPTVKTEAAKTTVAAQKRVNAKVPGNVSAGSRESTASNVTVSKTKTERQAARPRSTAAAKGQIASQVAKDSTAIKVTKMPVKTTATTTRKPRASGKSIAARKTLAAQQSVEAKAPDKASSNPRRSATSIVAAGKAKTAAAVTLPKGKAATTGNAGGRLKKSRSR